MRRRRPPASRSPQSSSISRSVGTTSFAWRRRTARSARGLGPPRETSPPPSHTSSGPRIRNSISPPCRPGTLTAVARLKRIRNTRKAASAVRDRTAQRRSTVQKFAEMNVAKPAIAAAVVVIVAGVGMLLPPPSASAPAQPGSSPTAARVGLASDSHNARQTVTENGIRFSFLAPRSAGWERHDGSSAGKPQRKADVAQQVRRGPAGRRGDHLLDGLSPRRPRRSVCSCAEPASRSISGRSRGCSVESARHQARQGAFGRQRGRAPSEARRAHRSRERRLRSGVLLHLATVQARCVLAYDGCGRHDPCLDRRRGRRSASSSQPRQRPGGIEKEIQQIVESIRFEP